MATQLSAGVHVSEFDLTTIVPAVATSTGALAGVFNWGPVNERVLIDSAISLVNIFGKPNSNNAETFFSGYNFLSYTNSLYVVRTANTTSLTGTIGARNSYANVGAVSNTPTVLNTDDFLLKTGQFDPDLQYVARYPGAAGNSLRISVCDSATSYSANLNMVANADVSATMSVNVGSSTVTVNASSFTANTLAANSYAATLAAELKIGDYVLLGNSSIGQQYCQINTVSTVVDAGFTFSTVDPYRLSTNFLANSSSSNTISRVWEFFNVVGNAPVTSDYVNTFGNTAAIDTMHVVVVDDNGYFSGQPGSVLETFAGVSRATDAITVGGQTNFYKTVINQGSQFVWVVNDNTNAPSNSAINIASSTNVDAINLSFTGGTDGYTEASVPLSVVATGYNLFSNKDDVQIDLILQGKPINGTSVANGFTVNNFLLANYIIDNVVKKRLDCVLFVTPDDGVVTGNRGLEGQALVAWSSVISSSSYVVIDSGYKYQYDIYNNVYRYIPMNGDIAGLCARTDNTNAPWWSPAGYNRGQINNVIKLRYNPSHANRDLMYSNGINPVISPPGQGIVLFGDKTFQQKPSAFDRINVRRLFLVLERAIAKAAQYSLFEFNDTFTQNQFKNLVTPYLSTIKGGRGITDFAVVCDATNNTPQIVDSNQFVGDIYIKPARSINFIQLNFVAVATGVSFNEVIGKF